MRAQLCILGSLFWAVLLFPLRPSAATPDTTGIGKCEAVLKYTQSLMGQHKPPEKVIQAADSLISVARSTQQIKYVGRGLHIKGSNVAKGKRPEQERGLEILLQGNRIHALTGDTSFQQQAQFSIAAVNYLMERYEEATQHVQQSIDLARLLGKKIPIGASINLMALIQRKLGNYETAVEYLQSGIEEVDTRLKYMLLQNLGITYKDMEQYEDAETCLKEVAAYYRSTRNPSLLMALTNLGTVELRLENPKSALSYFKEAEKLLSGTTSFRNRSILFINIGVALRDLGNCSSAIPYFVQAREILEELGEKSTLVQSLENEAECRFNAGQAHLAYPLLEQAKTISDSLFDLDRTEAISRLEQEYRQKEKANQIAELEVENQLVLERNAAAERTLQNQYTILALLGLTLLLTISLGVVILINQKNRWQRNNEADKQQLLRQQIKPHFIFNALNSVQHFLLHDQKKEGLLYLGKFGSLLRLILNNSQHDLVPVSEELTLIRHYLEMEQVRANHAFEFTIERPEQESHGGWMVPGMVLQVLVENAIWHGAMQAKEKGKVNVSLQAAPGGFELKISDNGPGIGHSKSPTNSGHISLGLELVKKRLKRASRNKSKFQLVLKNRAVSEGSGACAVIQAQQAAPSNF